MPLDGIFGETVFNGEFKKQNMRKTEKVGDLCFFLIN